MDQFPLLPNIRAFISVVEQGSFSASAKQLNLSQPSVSRKVSALETQLGIRLLHRSTRSLSLTEAGKIYYERVRHIQENLNDAAASISGFKDRPSGILRISVPYLWAEKMILPMLPEFMNLYPDIKLEIEVSDDFSDLVEDRLDLVIRIGDLGESSHIMVPFGEFKFHICGTPQYLEKHGMPTNSLELQKHAFIQYKNSNRLLLRRGKCESTFEIPSILKSDNPSVLLQAVQQHCGLAVLPDWVINPCLVGGGLVSVMPDHEIHMKNLLSTKVFALYSSRVHLAAKVRAFIDFFRPN